MSYIKILLFLFSLLIFWLVFGLFAYHALPIGQVIKLIISCFTGHFSQKLNHLQKNLQNSEVTLQSDSAHKARRLYNLNVKSQLYVGILERLNVESRESRERIAHTIEALEFKRSEISNELDPIKPLKYQRLDKFQQELISILASDVEKGYKSIGRIVYSLSRTLEFSNSTTAVEELLDRLSTEVAINSRSVDPATLLIIRQLEELLRNSLIWGIDTDQRQLRLSLNDSLSERDSLAATVDNLSQINQSLLQAIREKAEEIAQLEGEIPELQLNSSILQNTVDRLERINNAKQSRIDKLSRVITESNDKNRDLQAQIETFNEYVKQASQEIASQKHRINQLVAQLNQLRNDKEQYEAESMNLRKQLNELSEKLFAVANLPTERRRNLFGNYIGNVKKTNTKYHFNPNCYVWWSLVGQYFYSNDKQSNNIRSSSNPEIFMRAGLEDCDICSGRNRSL